MYGIVITSARGTPFQLRLVDSVVDVEVGEIAARVAKDKRLHRVVAQSYSACVVGTRGLRPISIRRGLIVDESAVAIANAVYVQAPIDPIAGPGPATGISNLKPMVGYDRAITRCARALNGLYGVNGGKDVRRYLDTTKGASSVIVSDQRVVCGQRGCRLRG